MMDDKVILGRDHAVYAPVVFSCVWPSKETEAERKKRRRSEILWRVFGFIAVLLVMSNPFTALPAISWILFADFRR